MLSKWGSLLVPALDLQFATEVVDPRITFSGGVNGTRINSAGLIVAASAPRFDYNPATLAAKALLIENASTNLLLNSKLDGSNLTTQSVAVTAQAYTLSFYGTGTVTLSGTSTAGPAIGAGAFPARQTLTFTPTAGALTLTVAGTVQFAQLEAGTLASSFVPTGGATVTRTTDAADMTGTNFSNWYLPAQGTYLFEGDYAATAAITSALFAATDNPPTTNWQGVQGSSVGLVSLLRKQGATSGGVIAAANAATLGVALKVAFSYAVGGTDAICLNGGVVATGAGMVTAPAVAQLRLGNFASNPGPINGHVKRFRYWSRQFPTSVLQSLST